MRRAVVAAVLLWAALWPLLHHGLVRRYGLNPWKFGAWAMYTVPTPPVLVGLFSKGPDGYRRVKQDVLSPALVEQQRRFEMDRHVWGELARPDALGEAALAELTTLPNVVVLVDHLTLDRGSGMMTSAKQEYSYDRRRDAAAGQ